ncbi:hypothetical protein [Chlamydiifrater phoenicopteri]|uniref:hypothetical protein n=1 Tax=Chlamydiifrater phoenicopteri TaxID=2681469 RepID=UPI001BD139BE|nr:hypothetical protein [Chlamydiifrater phoenicopteri]
MSSPIGGGSPSSPSEEGVSPEKISKQSEQPSSITEMVSRTLLLLQDLQTFLSDPQKTSSPVITEKLRHLEILKFNAELVQRIARETSSSLTGVATAMVACNLHLEQKIKDNQELTQQEISAITSTLRDISESGGSGSSTTYVESERIEPPAPIPKEPKKTTPGTVFPIKKRTYTQAFSEESLPTIKTSKILEEIFAATESLQPKPNYSLQAFIDILDMTEKKKPWLSSSFPEHNHSSPDCIRCYPFQKLLGDIVPSESAETLKWQLQTLMNHVDKEILASAILSTPEATAAILNTQYLSDSLLALLLYKCNAPESICLPKTENPKTQGIIYFFLQKVIHLGINHHTISLIRKVWKTAPNAEGALKNLSIRLTFDAYCQNTKLLLQEEFVVSFPRLFRAYPFIAKGNTYYTYRPLSVPFIDSLFCATIKTLDLLRYLPESCQLFLQDKDKNLVPHTEMFMLVCCLILLSSSSKCKFQILASKANVTLKELIGFKDEETQILSRELYTFTKKNNIKSLLLSTAK